MLFSNGSFNRSEILKLAHRWALDTVRRPLPGFARKTWREAFKSALREAWACAKRDRTAALRTPAQIARDEERASLLFGAAMIDNTRRSLATQAAIEARFAA